MDNLHVFFYAFHLKILTMTLNLSLQGVDLHRQILDTEPRSVRLFSFSAFSQENLAD